MKTRQAFVFVVLIAALVGAILMLAAREPRYHGRSLTSWLQQCSDTPLAETQRLDEAQKAIRALPLDKVLPRLLRLVETKDDPASQWIKDKSEELKLDFLKWRLAEDCQQLGIAGFETLATNAAPAINALAKLLDDPKHAFTAARCLAGIGKPAESALCQCLTNQEWRVRQMSVFVLASVTDDVEVYVDRLTNSLHDSDESVRFAAVQGIGAQTELPDKVIPLLLAALADPGETIASNAAAALEDFGTNAVTAFPVLSNVVEKGSSANTANRALRTLVAIDPSRALPMVLKSFQSTEQPRRRAAFRILCNYPLKTPDRQTLIEQATTDSDPAIARRAKTLMTDQYRKAHPNETPFPDEPSYGGKPLGDWLLAQDNGDMFSKEAQDALRHMGTNALPALLRRLAYKQPPFNLPAPEINHDALKAFILLAEEAKPAIPQLMSLMDTPDGDTALFSMMAAVGTGADAVPCLIKGLTNHFADVRGEAASYLGNEFGAQFLQQRRAALPFLVNLLTDTNESVRMNATHALRNIDPQTALRFGIK